MKALAFHLSTVLVASLVMALPALGQGTAASPDAEHEPEEILALKKKLAEQDRRISQLEEQVRMLLAAEKPSSAATASLAVKTTNSSDPAQSSPSEPASKAVVSKSAEAKKEPETPALAVAQTQPEKPKAGSVLAPIHFGGDVYLYQYVPAGVSGANPKFELYAFSALVDGQKGPWGFHADYRLRTTKLRSFFPGNTWLQQGYVRYDTPWGEIRAGSFYRRVGIEWDDSFFGNIQYFDGLKLDPQFGVGFSGSHDISGRLGAEYSLQYFSTDSRVNGSLPGRDFVSEIGARAKNDVTMRFAPVWRFSKNTSLTVGGSFAQGTIDRDGGPNNTRTQAAADGTLQLGPLLTYGEILRQTVNGVVALPPQNASYVLGGIRWARGRYQPRFNFSQGNYHGVNGRREFILQPGVTIRLADNLSFIYEFDFWRKISEAESSIVDRSLNLVLLYHF